MLDVAGPAERTGKHRGTDLLDGTVTLPFILARERDPELARARPAGDRDAARRPRRSATAIAATGALEAGARAGAGARRRGQGACSGGLPARSGAALDLVADGVVARYS